MPSIVYVAYLLAFMPWMAFRSMRRLAPPLGVRPVLAGGVTFLACVGLMLLNRAVRAPAERRTMAVYRLMPRAGREWILCIARAA